MKIFCIIVFALCCIGECVAMPFFVKFSWPNKTMKSFIAKMICSACFFIAGLCACKIANNTTSYATTIMWGLALGWVGDVFLHIIKDNIIFTGIGGAAFLAGHIFYIIAFQKAIAITYPASSAIEWYEVLFVLAAVATVAVLAVKKGIKMKPYMAAGVLVYFSVLMLMLVKALHYVIGEFAYGLYDHPVGMIATVGLGGLLFAISDTTLGLMMFGGQGKNYKLKWTYVVTYFVAQILIASSVFIIYTKDLVAA